MRAGVAAGPAVHLRHGRPHGALIIVVHGRDCVCESLFVSGSVLCARTRSELSCGCRRRIVPTIVCEAVDLAGRGSGAHETALADRVARIEVLYARAGRRQVRAEEGVGRQSMRSGMTAPGQ